LLLLKSKGPAIRSNTGIRLPIAFRNEGIALVDLGGGYRLFVQWPEVLSSACLLKSSLNFFLDHSRMKNYRIEKSSLQFFEAFALRVG
jgi:hypothetical protein